MESSILKHTQLFKHDPENGTWGDCWRTCIACILMVPVDDVPHVFDKGVDSDTASAAMKAFLAERGVLVISSNFVADGMSLQYFLDLMANWYGDQPYMFIGRSSNGTNHVVICQGNKIIHDPSIDQSGIVGPNIGNDGKEYWSSEMLVRPATTHAERRLFDLQMTHDAILWHIPKTKPMIHFLLQRNLGSAIHDGWQWSQSAVRALGPDEARSIYNVVRDTD